MRNDAISRNEYRRLRPIQGGHIGAAFVGVDQKVLQQLKLHTALHHHLDDPRVADPLS
jgi:hypothetical protein